jgi:peptide/nickel transport system permease protein
MRDKKYISHAPSFYVWKRFKKNKLALYGLVIIFISFLISILGYTIMPDSSPMANDMSLQLTTRKPGFKIKTLLVRKNKPVSNNGFFHNMFLGKENEYMEIPIADYHFDGGEIVFEEYSGIESNDGDLQRINLPQVLYPLSLNNPDISISHDSASFILLTGEKVKKSIAEMQAEAKRNNMITKRYLLGTDRFGRDFLSRLMAGTKISLAVGLISVFISLFIGITLGAIAGYFRGWADNLIMWFINVVWSIPTLLLVIAITLALGKGFWQVFVAVGLTMWVDVARLVRGQIFSLRELEFIEAGKALGFQNYRLITRHILPNIMGPVIVISASNFASAILLEAGLSFLGVGAQPPTPSWGMMIKENYGYIIMDAAYLAVLPGLAIMILVLAFTFVGNGLRDAYDSKDQVVIKG